MDKTKEQHEAKLFAHSPAAAKLHAEHKRLKRLDDRKAFMARIQPKAPK